MASDTLKPRRTRSNLKPKPKHTYRPGTYEERITAEVGKHWVGIWKGNVAASDQPSHANYERKLNEHIEKERKGGSFNITSLHILSDEEWGVVMAHRNRQDGFSQSCDDRR